MSEQFMSQEEYEARDRLPAIASLHDDLLQDVAAESVARIQEAQSDFWATVARLNHEYGTEIGESRQWSRETRDDDQDYGTTDSEV